MSIRATRQTKTVSMPGGTLENAVFDRQVMNLADRGSASALIGDRWANLAANKAMTMVGGAVRVPETNDLLQVERVVRLDDVPSVAIRASKQGLQNPDLLFVGKVEGAPAVQAVDAKFSVETARSKQVSVEMLEGLFGLGAFMQDIAGGIDPDARNVPGLFLSPDSALTQMVIKRGRGITKLTVSPEELLLVGVSAAEMFVTMDGSRFMTSLFEMDDHLAGPFDDFLSGIYYFRLARGVVGMWVDEHRPLFGPARELTLDTEKIGAQLEGRAGAADSAWHLVLEWSADADATNRQRAIIDRELALPLAGRELREWVSVDAAVLKVEPPSMNQVRRRLGGWYRRSIHDQVGTVVPPLEDLRPVLKQLAAAAAIVQPDFRLACREIVGELATQAHSNDVDAPASI